MAFTSTISPTPVISQGQAGPYFSHFNILFSLQSDWHSNICNRIEFTRMTAFDCLTESSFASIFIIRTSVKHETMKIRLQMFCGAEQTTTETFSHISQIYCSREIDEFVARSHLSLPSLGWTSENKLCRNNSVWAENKPHPRAQKWIATARLLVVCSMTRIARILLNYKDKDIPNNYISFGSSEMSVKN